MSHLFSETQTTLLSSGLIDGIVMEIGPCTEGKSIGFGHPFQPGVGGPADGWISCKSPGVSTAPRRAPEIVTS